MVRKSRKSNGSFGLTSRLLSPFVRIGEGVGNSANKTARGVGSVAKTVVRTATGVANSLGKSVNRGISNLTKRRKGRRGNTRRNYTSRR